MAAVSWMESIGVEPELSYEEVAQEMGISRVRVMQLEKSALRKIRRAQGVPLDVDQQYKTVRRCAT